MSYIVVDKTAFDEAVAWGSTIIIPIFPKDDLLRFYAYYKIENGILHQPCNKQPIVSALKANAIMQLSHLSIEMAQDRYSALV